MKPHNRANALQRGLTLIEVIVGVVVAGLAVALVVGAAQPQADRAAKIARCANNLRLLAAANHCYADDFGGKFFYNLAGPESLTTDKSRLAGFWHDPERVGRYLTGESLLSYRPPNARAAALSLGLGGRSYICPNDDGGARSYAQNYWASGIEIPAAAWTGDQWGRFFDRSVDGDLDRLILFGEKMGLAKTQDGRWVTFSALGGLTRPGALFGGRPPGSFAVDHRDSFTFRWRPFETYPSILDYGRHGEVASREKAQGILNFAYADGHVSARAHSDLYDPVTLKSTFDSLWSPMDRELFK